MIQLPTIPQYILESSICMIVFYGLYYMLFKKETFHHFNRFYILATSLLSVLIPLIDYESAVALNEAAIASEPLIQYKAEANHFSSSLASSQFYQVAVGDMLRAIYYIGLFLLSLKFLHTTFQLMENIQKRNKVTADQPSTIKASGASLFSHLYWTDEDDDDKDYTRFSIKKKGLKNIKSWHVFDVIIMELIVIVNWFNPLVYLFRNNFFKTHAYIVDQQVANSISNRMDYAEELSSSYRNENYTSLQSDHLSMINRVMMLSRKPSNTLAKFKPLLFIPVAMSLMSLFSFDYSANLSEEVKTGLNAVENSIYDASDYIVLNLTHSKRSYEWEFKWGDHIYGLTSKDDNGNLKYDMSKQISLFDLYESIENTPSYKTKGIYESMGFDIKITSNSDTVSNISVPVGDYDKLGERMKEEIVKHKTPFNIYFSNIGSEEGKRNGGFMITVYQFMKSADKEEQGEERKVEAKWGELNLKGADFGWVISNNSRHMYGRWNQLRYSEKPFNIKKDEFLEKINSNFILKVNDVEISTKESTQLTLNVMRPEMTRSNVEWNPEAKKIETREGARSVSTITQVYHGRSVSMVQDEYNFKQLLDSGDTYIKNVLGSLTDGDIVTIAAIDTLDSSDTGNHFFFNMTIKDESAAYNSPYEVELPPTSENFTNFQIYYNAEDDQTYVKVDTNAIANDNIVRAYRHSESYKLTHVPDFKTKKRVNDTRSLPGGKLTVDSDMRLNTAVLKMQNLNEHYTLSDRMIRMDWGHMVSLPGIGNFSQKEFKRSSRSNLLLSAGDNFLELARFDMVIITADSEPLRIRTDNVRSDLCRQALSEIVGEASIYFDNIVIVDNDEYKYYPYQFVFSVE